MRIVVFFVRLSATSQPASVASCAALAREKSTVDTTRLTDHRSRSVTLSCDLGCGSILYPMRPGANGRFVANLVNPLLQCHSAIGNCSQHHKWPISFVSVSGCALLDPQRGAGVP